ncbi:hypothetical protein [Photobacterium sp. GB-72]|uniref:hypothetical protein n=1 Tax=Photobacterium sp. GB-72 TaxID=2022105 RepID=UPI000D17C952|nr:hypothetical protein [Photobacterium sp. GB-72]PSV28096.1 hypothetical protein C9J40_19645 [Photobacterium sp. GB-72]
MKTSSLQTDMFADALLCTESKASGFVELNDQNASSDFNAFTDDESLQWLPEEVEKLRYKLAKQSIGILVDSRASDEERDDVFMWLRQDNFSEPFSYYNCLWSEGINPVIFRNEVFDGMYRKLSELRKDAGGVPDDLLKDYLATFDRKKHKVKDDSIESNALNERIKLLQKKRAGLKAFGQRLIKLTPQSYTLLKWLEQRSVVRNQPNLNQLEEFVYRFKEQSQFPKEIG